MQRIKKIRASVFTRLLFVMMITVVIINLIVGGFFSHAFKDAIETPLQKKITQYFDYIIADIGIPPSLETARRLAKASQMNIHYIGTDIKWSTAGSVPENHRLRFKSKKGSSPVRLSHRRGVHFFEIRKPHGRFIFEFAVPDRRDLNKKRIIALLMLLTFVILIVEK